MEKLDFIIRKAKPEDVDYITATWLNSVYEQCKRDMKKSVFMPNHNKLIKERLPLMRCLVACNPEDQDQIYGYIVFNRPSVVHFAYTKGVFRKLGVFKKLLDAAEIKKDIEATHKGPMFKTLESKLTLVFNPYKFYEVKE